LHGRSIGCIIFNMAKSRRQPKVKAIKVSTPLEDRRGARRLEKPIGIHYRCGDRPYQRSRAADFSKTGAQVLVPEPLEPKTNIFLMFELGPRLKLTVTARMVWQRPADEGYCAGLQFALPPEVETRLGKWLSRQFKAA